MEKRNNFYFTSMKNPFINVPLKTPVHLNVPLCNPFPYVIGFPKS